MRRKPQPRRHAQPRRTTAPALVALLAVLALLSTIFAPPASAQPASKKVELDRTMLLQAVSADAPDRAGWLGPKYDASSEGSLYSVAQNVDADDVWRSGFTGEGVHVAVIDTGVTPVAPLGDDDKVVAVVDLSFEAGDKELRYLDTYGHGTHVMGIIAGHSPGADPLQPGTSDFLGMAPDAGLVSIKVGDNTGAVDVSQVIAAIDWVIQHRNEDGLNIRVLNLSYGTDSDQDYRIDPLAFAVERAWDAGIMVVVAAGNDTYSHGFLANPATDPYVLAVGDVGRTTAYYRARAAHVRQPDVLAPGTSIESLAAPWSRATTENPRSVINDGQLLRGTGSSQAAAVVSGGAALLFEARPDLTPDQAKALLMHSVDSDGVVDFQRALRSRVPVNHVQTWERSTGLGSLEAARGTHHVTVNGEVVKGEVTVWGNEWVPEKWTELSAQGVAWSGASWSGASWAGASWAGASWAGASWAGASWAGASWAGSSWAGSSWAGASWAGSSWAGASWAGASWAGSSWAGASWAGASWAGSSWAGASWGRTGVIEEPVRTLEADTPDGAFVMATPTKGS